MKFSIVVPTCNRNDSLIKCLDQLAPGRQALDIDFYEVIVSDDGKENQAKRLINDRYKWAKWVEGPKLGPAGNRNNGARYASGEWLVFIDDDCLPTKNWLLEIFKAIRNNLEITVIEGKTLADRPQKRFNESAPINISGGLFWTCNIAILKIVFFEIGGFDIRLFSLEDVILRELLKYNGIRIYFIPSVIVIHPWKRESVKSILKDKHMKYNMAIMSKRLYPNFSEYVNSNMFLKNCIYRFYYSFFNIWKYKFRGYYIILFEGVIDIYYSVKFKIDYKDKNETSISSI